MAEVVFEKPLKAGKSSKAQIVEERQRDAKTGKLVTIKILDKDNSNFGSQFETAFKKNVAAARRDNKSKIGVADVRPKRR